MKQFRFTFLDANGNQTAGRLAARDRDSAVKLISERYGTLIELKETRSSQRALNSRVSTAEVMLTTQQLAAMLRSGIPLLQSLDVLAADAQSRPMKAILNQTHLAVSEGSTLSDAMAAFPNAFSPLYVKMVTAGEAGGSLPTILSRLAGYLGQVEELKGRVKGALYYPLIVVVIAFLIAGFIFVFGVRQFQQIYAGLNVELPLATRMMLGVGEGLANYWWVVLLLAGAAVWGLKNLLNSPAGVGFRDQVLISMPAIGPLMRKVAVARFARTLATLYAAGVPIVYSLELVAGAAGNRVMEGAVLKALSGLKSGESIVGPLRESGMFPRMAVSMIATGEQSGTLDAMLNELATFYEQQVDLGLRGLVALLEPMAIVLVGLLVGATIVCLGLPLVKIVQVL